MSISEKVAYPPRIFFKKTLREKTIVV